MTSLLQIQNNHRALTFRSRENKRSSSGSLIAVIALSVMVLALTTSIAFAKSGDENQPIDVSADRSEYDDKAGIQRLVGNVEITQGSMKIKAESIAIHLEDNRLARIEGTGAPIRFEQLNDADETIVGEANNGKPDYNSLVKN